MSPRRRHGGGRPRSANSILDLAERWGISEKTARRLAKCNLDDHAMAVLVFDSKRSATAKRGGVEPEKYSGGMRGLGMRSRTPAARA